MSQARTWHKRHFQVPNAPTSILSDSPAPSHLIPNAQSLHCMYTSPKSQLSLLETLHNASNESHASELSHESTQLQSLHRTQSHLQYLLASTSALIQHCTSISAKSQFISAQSEQFDASCGALTRKITALTQFHEAIRQKLSYFDEMERFQQILNRGNDIATLHTHLRQKFFSEQMIKLDESIAFLESNLQYKDALRYLNKFKHIKTRALACVRDYVVGSMREVGEKIQGMLHEVHRSLEEKRLTEAAESASTLDVHHAMQLDLEEQQYSLLYIEFQSEVDHLRQAIEMIELRCEPMTPASFNDETSSTTSSITSLRSGKTSAMTSQHATNPSEYLIFLQDCFNAYQQQRRLLVQPIIQKGINELVENGDLIQIVRSGCSMIIQIAMHESKLYSRLFHSHHLRNSFRQLIQSFCNTLYEGLRSVVIHEDNIELLGSCVEILRKEILRDAIRPKRDLLRFVEPIVHHMVQDVQERLIFRSSMYIRENIQLFQPTDQDLNYPKKLMQKSAPEQSGSTAGTTDTSLDNLADDSTLSLYTDWYPPLPRALNLLSKLYNRIEIGVFEGLAQEIISLCTNAFIDASQQIAQRSSVLDGELFLIKHLLALRIELTPFEKLNFTTVETSLDFSHVREGIKRFLKGQATFRMKNLIFDIMSHSQPRIIHNAVDSKKDLEKRLKIVYESFILNVTRLCFDDLMIHVKKTHAEAVNRTESTTTEGAINMEAAQAVYTKSIDNLKRVLSEQLTPKMRLYLEHEKTQLELFKGIKLSLLGVYKTFLGQITNAGGNVAQFLTVQQLSDLIDECQPSVGQSGEADLAPLLIEEGSEVSSVTTA